MKRNRFSGPNRGHMTCESLFPVRLVEVKAQLMLKPQAQELTTRGLFLRQSHGLVFRS